jgi:hypothetical protein
MVVPRPLSAKKQRAQRSQSAAPTHGLRVARLLAQEARLQQMHTHERLVAARFDG